MTYPRFLDSAHMLVAASPTESGPAEAFPGLTPAPWRRWWTLAEAKAALADLVQAEAARRVAAISPPERQAQHTALAVRLLDLASQRALSEDEIAAQMWLRGVSNSVTAVRSAEATKQSAIQALASLEACEAFDVGAGWP